MTPKKVREAVEEIREVCYDSERAHTMEDILYADLLEAIAAGKCVDVSECARIALLTQRMEFERWI